MGAIPAIFIVVRARGLKCANLFNNEARVAKKKIENINQSMARSREAGKKIP